MENLNFKLGFMWCCLLISFSSMAHVNLINPRGGETFNPGETVKIEWEIAIQHDTKNWDLYFSSDGGKTYETLESDMEVATLSYFWTVPSNASQHARIKIVQDNAASDYSDESGDFRISGTTTGLEKFPDHSNLIISPNPAQHEFKILQPTGVQFIRKILAIDRNGKQLFAQKIGCLSQANDFTLDVSNWPPGLYYLLIYTESALNERKLVVQ